MVRWRAALACLWAVAVTVVYVRPGLAEGMRDLLHGSLPTAAVGWQPLRRAGSIAAAAAVFGAAWGYGAPLARWSRPRAGLEASLTALAAGAGALSLGALALSALGLLKPPALVAVVAGGLLLAAARAARGRPRLRAPAGPRGARGRPRRLPSGAIERVTLALLALAAAFALIGALAPEVEYDALWYHLDLPKRFLESGSLVSIRCDYVGFYPMDTELLFGYGLALADGVAAKLVHTGFGVLLALATYRLGTQVATRRAALLAAAILALTPTVLWEATTAYVELATALFVTLALCWLIRYADDRSTRTLATAAILTGLALATKTLALLAAAPLALLVVLVTRGPTLPRLGAGAGFAGLALLPALPWFIRAQVETGNPVFPSAYGVFGADADIWSPGADAGQRAFLDRFGYGHDLGSLLALPWDTTMHAAAFGGSLGVAYLILVPFALQRRPPLPLALTALFCLGYVLLWASPPSSQQLRFLVPVLGPLAVIAATGFERAWALAREAGPAAAALLATVVFAGLALGLPPLLRVNERGGEGTLTNVLRETPVDAVTGAEGEDVYLARRIRAYPAIRRLNRIAGAEELAVVGIDPFANFYSRPAMAPDYAVCLARAGIHDGGPGAVRRALARNGVGWVLVDSAVRDQWSLHWLAPELRGRVLTPVYRSGSVRLFRVRALSPSRATSSRRTGTALAAATTAPAAECG